ncbi:MAG: Tol-Pal system beta propeller repeat protein TolB [Desulfuromonadia bacterium]
MTIMLRCLLFIILVPAMILPSLLHGEEPTGYLEVTAPGKQKIRLHVATPIPLGGERLSPDDEQGVASLLSRDLHLSGLFTLTTPLRPLTVTSMRGEDLDREGARQAGIDMVLLLGYRVDGGTVVLDGRLYDIFKGQDAVAVRFVGASRDLRHLGHRVADEILRVLTGTRGFFSRRIAFVSTLSGNKEIYLSDVDGKNILRLTSNRSINLYPDFSPDGSRLLYTSYQKGGPHLFVRELSTGEEVQLTRGVGTNIGGAWDPSGKEILFSGSGEKEAEIYRIPATGGGGGNLTNAEGIDLSPSPSPDGSRIVFVSDRRGRPLLFVMNRDGSDQRRLTTSGGYDVSPRWSPRGDRIVFSRQTSSGFQIFTISPDGNNEVQLTFEGSNEHPRWSPDGRFILFTSTRTSGQGVYVMRSDGSGQTLIVQTRGRASHPVWEP